MRRLDDQKKGMRNRCVMGTEFLFQNMISAGFLKLRGELCLFLERNLFVEEGMKHGPKPVGDEADALVPTR